LPTFEKIKQIALEVRATLEKQKDFVSEEDKAMLRYGILISGSSRQSNIDVVTNTCVLNNTLSQQ